MLSLASYFATSLVCCAFCSTRSGSVVQAGILILGNEVILSCYFAFVFEALGDQIIFVNRPDKKKILFYNDKSCQFTVDEGRCLLFFMYVSVIVDLNSS